MSISSAAIDKIATLARVQVGTAERDELRQRLNDILEMVDRLQSADTDGISPMAHPRDEHQRLRPDTVTETDQREAFQAIAPQTENGLYLVPRVIE